MASRAAKRQFLPNGDIQGALDRRQDQIFADERLFEKANAHDLVEVSLNIECVASLLEARLVGTIFVANIVAQAHENQDKQAINSLSEQFSENDINAYRQEAEQTLKRKESGFFKATLNAQKYTHRDTIDPDDISDDSHDLNINDKPIIGPGR